MAAYVAPRRVTSTPTAISVVAAATTQLSIAAASMTTSDTYLAFKGLKSGTSTVGSLDYRIAHPSSGFSVDPTESGHTNGQTGIDWADRGIYDNNSTSRRVMWMGSGAGTAFSGGYVFNMHTIYDEATDTWSCNRGFRSPNTTTSESGIAHLYGTNVFHPVNRDFIKIDINLGMLHYNLDTNTIGNKTGFTISGGIATNGECGLEWIPARQRLWIRHLRSANNMPMIWEFNAAMSNATQIYASDTTFASEINVRSPLVYNQNAFGGAGGAFMGGATAITVEMNSPTYTIHTNSVGRPPSTAFTFPNRGHVCQNPAGTSGFAGGDGWFYMCPDDGHMWHLSSGSPGAGNSGTWTQRGLLPQAIRDRYTGSGDFDYVVVPLELEAPNKYGVVWIIGKNIGADRAWLYKP